MSSPQRTSAALVKRGERLALFNYYTVDSTDDEYVHLTDENGLKLRISNGVVDKSMVSTSQFTREFKLNRTQIGKILEGAGHLPFRVTFHKKVESNHVADGLEGKDLETPAKRRKIVKDLMEGQERIMHARLWRSGDQSDMEFGRYKVLDLEATDAHPEKKPQQRQVDTRTITELIIEGVRYYV